MRIAIFTDNKPVLSQTWLINELDILDNNQIDYLVFYNSMSHSVRQRGFKRYENKFIYIPLFPKTIFNFIYYIFLHLKLFLSYPLRYSRVIVFLIKDRHWIYFRNFFKLIKIIPVLITYNPDLIYAHYAYNEYIFAFLTGVFLGKKYGLILHSTYPYPQYISSILAKAYFIMVKSKHVKEYLVSIYPKITNNNIKVLPFVIDTGFFCLSEKRKIDKIFKIISISRFVQMKGYKYLLKACYLLSIEHRQFRCILIGYGSEERVIRNYIQSYGLEDSIKIYKGIPHSLKLIKFLTESDLFILPAIQDSYGEFDFIPNAVLEAMAMELPVITTKVTGMQDIATDKKNIFIVEEKDAVVLADKIKEVMDMPVEERKTIGKMARNIILTYYDKDIQGKQFVRFLISHLEDNAQ